MKKINLMVCPHDTARKPERWFFFAQQLSKKLHPSIIFKQSIDFKDFHENMVNSGLIYTNPQDSLILYNEHHYIPLVKPGNLYDEVVFIANSKIVSDDLQGINDQPVASVNSMMPTCLALEHLKKKSITPASVINQDSWLAVIKAVYSGGMKYGFVYRDYYESLNALTRKAVKVIGSTNDEKIYHMIMLSPEQIEFEQQIRDLLLDFHNQKVPKEIINNLNISHFEKVAGTDLKILKQLSNVLNVHNAQQC